MPGVLSALLGSFGGPFAVQYLVVAGGGGGGSSGVNYGGGGGAGGYRSSVLGEVTGGLGSAEQTFKATISTQYSVSVGAGGGGNANGSNSSVFGIVSTGGGRGRGDAYGAQGFEGGSGGGGTYVNGLGGLRTTNPIQGHVGGVGASAGNPPPQSNAGSGGGGGAGGPGYDLQVPGFFRNSEGAGGLGLQSSITGTATFYAAGGVGSSYYSGSRTNDIGGGSNPGVSGVPVSNVGTINTGSGGGGGVNGAGGLGGSGVVILRYPDSFSITLGPGLVGATSNVGAAEKVTTITSGTGNFSFAYSKRFSLSYLLVGGGGGGGGAARDQGMGAGAGAGGVLSSTFTADLNNAYTVSVGGGGTGSFGSNGAGANGGPTTIFGLTALGGGGGGQWWNAARSGASGGGGGNNGGGQTGASGTPPQGNNGGNGSAYASPGSTAAGGGGGMGSVGGNASGGTGGNGGTGFSSSITGSALFYAGGGGGGGTGGTGGIGGSGVGGNGGTNNQNGFPGLGNRGSGGGGAADARTGNYSGGNGGSGVVILRYPSDYSIRFGSGLTGSTSSLSTEKVTTITSGTGNVSFIEGVDTFQSALDNSPSTGLIGQFFNGDWRSTISTGNIGTLPLSSPTTYSSISYGSRGDFYGLLAIGYFKPPTTGTYTFFTSSDDGSGVWVGDLASAASGRTAANATLNNNLGGGQGDTKRSGSVALTGGVWYPIRIVHEEGSGGDNLTFSWSGPGIAETTSLSTHFKRPVNLDGSPLNTFM